MTVAKTLRCYTCWTVTSKSGSFWYSLPEKMVAFKVIEKL